MNTEEEKAFNRAVNIALLKGVAAGFFIGMLAAGLAGFLSYTAGQKAEIKRFSEEFKASHRQ